VADDAGAAGIVIRRAAALRAAHHPGLTVRQGEDIAKITRGLLRWRLVVVALR